jgi:hypothetical protein
MEVCGSGKLELSGGKRTRIAGSVLKLIRSALLIVPALHIRAACGSVFHNVNRLALGKTR